MKTIIAALFLCAGTGFLQKTFAQERVSVPLSDPARPASVHAHMLMGGITVRGADSREVVVETRGGHERPVPPSANGMHRLNLGGNTGLDIVEENNVVTVKTSAWMKSADLVITVPYHSSLQLKSITNGGIDVEHVDGEIDAEALNGAITLTDVSGSVIAHSLNGVIHATMDRVDPTKPMSFSTLNGEIDVTLPAGIRANVSMKTDNGEIYSDFDVKLEASSHAISSDSDEHHHGHHIRLDRTVRGTINGGGPEIQFTSFNGRIFIRRR